MTDLSPEERKRKIAKLKESWPRPRIGQRIKLRNGRIGEVVSVRSARDILKMKTEVQALMMISSMKPSFGVFWAEVFYEADLYLRGRMITITTREVDEILPPL